MSVTETKEVVGEGVRIILVGTGTGVGKTHVGCCLVRALASSGIATVGLKPVESGLAAGGEEHSDQAQLARAAEVFHVQHDVTTFHVKQSLYGFAESLSPHLAARHAGRRIDLGAIRTWVARSTAHVTVVESAGGLFSPLERGITNLDLVQALLPAHVLLVAPDRLGVLHDVTATLGYARTLGLLIHGVALSAPDLPDHSTGSNADELRYLGIADPLTTFPRQPAEHPDSIAAARPIIDWIHLRSPTGT